MKCPYIKLLFLNSPASMVSFLKPESGDFRCDPLNDGSTWASNDKGEEQRSDVTNDLDQRESGPNIMNSTTNALPRIRWELHLVSNPRFIIFAKKTLKLYDDQKSKSIKYPPLTDFSNKTLEFVSTLQNG